MNAGPVSHRSPVKFFLLILLLSFPFWLIGAVFDKALGLPMDLPISALMFPCPLIAAAILVYRDEGRDGLLRLLGRAFDYKRITKRRWYSAAFLLMPAILLLSYGAMRLVGRPIPDPEIPFLTTPVLFIAFFIGGIGEEGGWSGYVTDPMQARWGAFKASVMIGLVWAAWHIVPLVQMGRPLEWIGWWCLGTVALRVLTVWIYNSSGKSVMATCIFHAMSNVSYSLFPNNGSHYDPAVTGVLLLAAAAIVTVLWGQKTLARYRYVRTAVQYAAPRDHPWRSSACGSHRLPPGPSPGA